MPRARNALYVTRVEDRHGNWVQYNYANTHAEPVKLTSITSSDGRSITLTFSGTRVASATNGSREAGAVIKVKRKPADELRRGHVGRYSMPEREMCQEANGLEIGVRPAVQAISARCA